MVGDLLAQARNTIPEHWWTLVGEHWGAWVRSAIIILVGFVGARLLATLLVRPWRHRLSAQSRFLIRKGVTYTITILVIVTVLREFGFDLTTLLGAAGIAGVAIGFASQTSLSNIISGLFLLWEKPFEVGDVIRVGEHTGEVASVDLLSLTLRTFDNLSIRIPNETLVKTPIVNVTRYPIRRFDSQLAVAFTEEPNRVMSVIRQVAKQNPHVLDEPEPLVSFTALSDSLTFSIGLWHEKADLVRLRNTFLVDLKRRLEAEGIVPASMSPIVGSSPKK